MKGTKERGKEGRKEKGKEEEEKTGKEKKEKEKKREEEKILISHAVYLYSVNRSALWPLFVGIQVSCTYCSDMDS